MAHNESYQDWTSCEFYGHDYKTDEDNPKQRICQSCGDSYEDESNNETEQ